MPFRTLTVSILAAMYLADFCRYSNAAEIGDLQHVLEAVSEESLSSLAESKDINWPSMSLSFSAIPVVPGSSGAVRVSQNIALKLLDILKGYESSLDNDTSIEPINQFKVYSLVGMRLERAGGSLNICLLDSLNRCAMARLCHSVLSASLGLEAAQKTLESLYVPKYDKSFLEKLMSTRMSRDQVILPRFSRHAGEGELTIITLFIFHRRLISQRTVQTAPVVEAFNIVKQHQAGLCQALKAFGWHHLSAQGLRIHVEIKQSGGTVFGGLPGWPHALNHASPGTSKIAPSPIGWKHWLAETPYLLSLVPFGLPYRQIWDHSGSTLKQAEPGPLDRSSSSSLGLNNKGKFRS